MQDVDDRYRGIYKFVVPIKLGLFTLFAAVGSETRIPAIDDTFGDGYGDFWTLFMLICSAIALVASAFYPVAKRVEMVSIILITFLMGIYALSVLFQAIILDDPNRGAFGVAVFIFLVFPIWVVVDLLWDVRPKEEITQT